MSFLTPWLLAGLPLISLPLLIHLINQRRYQSIRWGAMMFLLAANRLSRGYARLRQWLILAARMAAIAGLVLAVSRPLASGWLGLTAGGRADTTLILLDRSPSMQQRGGETGVSKLETGRRQLVQTLHTLGSSRWVLIDSTTNKPRELESPEALLQSSSAEPASATADLPALLQAAQDYLRANRTGRTEIWICSDLRANDWHADSGRWQSLRDSFLEFPQGLRFHLLAYPHPAPDNISVRVTDVRRRPTSDGAELLVSLRLARDGNADTKSTIPVEFEIEGARSVVSLELASGQSEWRELRIPLERNHERGWGRVSIPADANPADNDFFFVFDQPAPRQTLLVADEASTVRPLQLAAGIAPDPGLRCAVELRSRDQLDAVPWDQVALVVWQGDLPTGAVAQTLQAFAARGGQVLFFPPREPGAGEFLGIRWQSWVDAGRDLAVETWRADQDLLAHTLSGAALPVGQLQIRRHCGLSGEFTPLATLPGGAPLIAKADAGRGGVYWCATNPVPGDSSLASQGVVLYVITQRALAAGSAALGNTRQLVAGEPPAELGWSWTRVAGAGEGDSTDYPFHRGIYAVGDKWLAVNRAADEDQAPVLPDARVAELFRGLDFARVDDRAGNATSLVQEIWRLFLATMLIALVAEAALCLPKLARVAGATA